jgi:adenine phosphoribosyltransferase
MELKYEGQKHYELEINGFRRLLPVVQISDNLWIASFVMLGDVALVNFCADALAVKLSQIEFDYLVGPEAKVLPLLHAISTYMGHSRYIVCRKSVKAYMKDPLVIETKSITTTEKQKLVMDSLDVERVKGKKVVIVDDVVSTGGTFEALEKILQEAGATVVGRASVLREGNAYMKDLIYLQDLPIFVK